MVAILTFLLFNHFQILPGYFYQTCKSFKHKLSQSRRKIQKELHITIKNLSLKQTKTHVAKFTGKSVEKSMSHMWQNLQENIYVGNKLTFFLISSYLHCRCIFFSSLFSSLVFSPMRSISCPPPLQPEFNILRVTYWVGKKCTKHNATDFDKGTPKNKGYSGKNAKGLFGQLILAALLDKNKGYLDYEGTHLSMLADSHSYVP